MKTYARQSVAALFAALSVSLSVWFTAPEARAQGSFSIERWLGPVNPTQTQINSLVTAEMNGFTTATAWTLVPGASGTVPINEIFSDNSGNGGAMFYTLYVTCPTGTTLGQTYVSYDSILGTYNQTFDQAGVSYTDEGVGITASGQQIWSGNSDNTVSKFYVVGANTTLDTGTMTLQQALNAWSPGFDENVTYSGNWGSVSASTSYVVPELNTDTNFFVTLGNSPNTITLSWKYQTYSNYTLTVAPTVNGPFSPVSSPLATNTGFISTTVSSTNGSMGFFRLQK